MSFGFENTLSQTWMLDLRDRLGLTFPVALDPTGSTERRLETDYLPTTLLIDRQGFIRAREVGGVRTG